MRGAIYLTECRVMQYALDVVEGRIVAGPHVRASCQRHIRDTQTCAVRGLYFDPQKCDRAFRFFEDVLKLSEGQFEDKPFELHPSQAFIVGSLFGWAREDGTRRYRRAYIEQGKGNGKSPLVGGIGLYGMAADKEPGAQIYAAGATREQASILFQDAVKMTLKSNELRKRITYSGNIKPWRMTMLKKPQAGSFFTALSREAGRTGSGPRPHFALCDEVHEHPDRTVMEILERGFKFRRQPLLVMITNSGTDRKSVCWEEHEHAVAVAHGDIEDDSTFSYVCGMDEDDDPLTDPSCWIKANPLLGVTITREYLEGVVKQGLQMPGKLNNILRLHFCVWTDAATAWISRPTWEACEDSSLVIDDFEGCRCSVGLDLSSVKDLSARAVVFEDGFREIEGRQKPCFAAFVHGYTPKETMMERAKVDRAPYDAWVKSGFITATPGSIIRFDEIASDAVDDSQRFDLQWLAYDRYLIKYFEQALDEMGVTLPMMDHPQSVSQRKDTPLWMPESIKFLEQLIYEKRLRVHVNPALRSAVAGATFWKSPAELCRFEKAKATSRIDLLVALTMGVGAAMMPFKDEESVYDKFGREKRSLATVATDGGEIDYIALNDPTHPKFRLMADRFEREQRLLDEDF